MSTSKRLSCGMKSNMRARELQIGGRIRRIREALRLSQAEFAEQLGITRQRLASYEEGRVAIRYDLALRLCRRFIVSEKWLATGLGDPRLLMDLRFDPVAAQIPVDSPYSKAFDDALSNRYEEVLRANSGGMRIQIAPQDDPGFMDTLLKGSLAAWREALPPEQYATLCFGLWEEGQRLMRRRPLLPWPEAIRQRAENSAQPSLSLAQGSVEKGLDIVSEYDNIKNVKGLMTQLLERIKRVTEQRGKKAALARHLGVPLPSVSQWLSGAREPGGEYALQMLKWVEQEERKQ
ncbi:MAG TPA: helix-turn-helix transcriptional regulator [Bryobacteraceae bacterium]|nr:helix-turn-helix transcriptional regulator [Bryobacteraceae bacterium]